MKELIDKYRPRCCGATSGTRPPDRSVLQTLFNQELVTGRPATVDDRCGLPDSDFNTPEYASSFALQTTKFEASRGIDPFSYGYNSATRTPSTPRPISSSTSWPTSSARTGTSCSTSARAPTARSGDHADSAAAAGRLAEGQRRVDLQHHVLGPRCHRRRPTFHRGADKAFYVTSLTQPGSTVTVHAPVPSVPATRSRCSATTARHALDEGGRRLARDYRARRGQHSGQYAWTFKINWTH